MMVLLRQIVIFVVVIFLCYSCIHIPYHQTYKGQTTKRNLALGKKAIASSIEMSELSAGFVTDGYQNTRWGSVLQADPQWLLIDLGGVYTIDKVRILWEESRATDYLLQISDDALNWNTVFSKSACKGPVDDMVFTPVNTRFVRIFLTKRIDNYGYSIREFEIYKTGEAFDSLEYESLVFNKPITASSSVGKNIASFVNDGLLDTRWESEYSDSQWISLDLDTVRRIKQLLIFWEESHAVDYKIQVSKDLLTWENVYQTNKVDMVNDSIYKFPMTSRIDIKPINTRYIKVSFSKRADNFGYSIWEMLAFD